MTATTDTSTDPGWVVLKYGGTSVASAANWPVIAGVLRDRQGEGLRPVLVHSALAGVSDRLESLARLPAADNRETLVEEIEARHHRLVSELGLEMPAPLSQLLEEMRRLTAGIALIGETSAPLEARLMSLGELMASAIIVAYLRREGFNVLAADARDVLCSTRTHPAHDPRRYLAAVCDSAYDPALAARWGGHDGVIVTQGFIASDDRGRTVLLGRGGSDTSAAYFAARLAARRLEIWTDVPGMFSANPRIIPSARLIRSLSFEEAQEIAATGGKVLHPRCLPIARKADVPVQIFDTARPHMEGTVISATGDADGPRVKAVSARRGITLVSMESLGMWQEAGFLARVFGVFAELGLSVDLVSTSESVVTVTLDETGPALDDTVLEDLSHRLEAHCRVRVLTPCAAVSLVGARMRANLHRLAPALESFEEHEIYLVSQAASDLNFTVVIEEDQAERMVRALHGLVVGGEEADMLFGPTWEQLTAAVQASSHRVVPWWERKRDELMALMASRHAAYVYDRAALEAAAEPLSALSSVDRIFYAIKANPHPGVLRVLREQGLGMECVSPGELDRVLTLFPDMDRSDVLFTPNFAERGEYAAAFKKGIRVTVDSLYPLQSWPEVFRGREIFVRMDLGEGSGHHQHVHTAGVRSKFGVGVEDLEALCRACASGDVRIVGLHVHGGSGIRDPLHWQRVATGLGEVAAALPDVRVLDLGGGLGVPEREGDAPLDLVALDRSLADVRAALPGYELWLEPGRYLVSDAGVLLARVTQTKQKAGARFVGVATGMNSLIRPALYGAYHRIVNLTRLGEPGHELVTVVGPICESGDRLGRDRLLPETREGDVLLIANAGAYGYAMSSRYNLREPAEELVL
jgi:diaminopimelate decarboxylase/aspartate kinase